jgi:hypothetical protein
MHLRVFNFLFLMKLGVKCHNFVAWRPKIGFLFLLFEIQNAYAIFFTMCLPKGNLFVYLKFSWILSLEMPKPFCFWVTNLFVLQTCILCLGNQNPIFALNFQYEGLDSSNDSFQNQIVEYFLVNLTYCTKSHSHPLSLLLFVINKFLIIFGVLNFLFTKSKCKWQRLKHSI